MNHCLQTLCTTISDSPMKKMLILFGFLSTLLTVSTSFNTIDELLEHKTKSKPPSANNESLNVKLGMYLESLGNFRSTEMSFDVDLYVYMSWRDERLSHNESDYVLINDEEIRKRMWVPDLYFANARQAHFQEVTVPNFNMFVAPDGTVAYSCRCTLTVACSLDLRFYPMDNQVCSIRVVSYAYIARQMNVTWFNENPIRHNPEIGLPEFQITAVSKGYCNGTYRYAMMSDSHKLDDFSCLSGLLYLSRSIGYNLVQSYIPTGLIVMISWVSFWIDRRAVPARVTLSFTTLVSLTTLGNGLRFGLPQVSYAKAIDLWYGVCMLFVFLALLEFAIVNSYMRKSEKFEQMAKRLQIGIIRKRAEGDNEKPQVETITANGGVHEKKAAFRYIDETNRTTLPAAKAFMSVKHASPPRMNKFPDKIKYEELTPEGFACSETEEKGFGNTVDSQTNSIYDNVSSPWRDFKLSLLAADDSSRGSEISDDELWGELSRNQPKVVYDMNGRTASTRESISLSRVFSRHALFIDKMCRYGFPIIFFVWNVWYWWYYLVVNGESAIVEEI